MYKRIILVVFCYGLQHGGAFTHEPAVRPRITVTVGTPATPCWCVHRNTCAAAARAPAALLRSVTCAYVDAEPYVCCDELTHRLPFTQRPPTVEDNDISHDSHTLDLPDLWHVTSAGTLDVSFQVPSGQRPTTYRVPVAELGGRSAATSQPYDRRVQRPTTTFSISSRPDGHPNFDYERNPGQVYRPGDSFTKILLTTTPTLPVRTVSDPYSSTDTISSFPSWNYSPTKTQVQYTSNRRNTKRRKNPAQHESSTQTLYFKPVLNEEFKPFSSPHEDNSPYHGIIASERRHDSSRLPQEKPAHRDETHNFKPVLKDQPRPFSSPHRGTIESERRHDISRVPLEKSPHHVNEPERRHDTGRVPQENPPHRSITESDRWHNTDRGPQGSSPHHDLTESEPHHNTGRESQNKPPHRDDNEGERQHGTGRVTQDSSPHHDLTEAEPHHSTGTVPQKKPLHHDDTEGERQHGAGVSPQEGSPPRGLTESERRHETGPTSHHSHPKPVLDWPHEIDSPEHPFPSNPHHHHHHHSDGFHPHSFPDVEHSQTLPEEKRRPNPIPLLPPEFLENETKSTPSEHSTGTAPTTTTTTTSTTTKRPAKAVSTTTTTSRPAPAYDDAIVFPESAEVGGHSGKRWTQDRAVEKHHQENTGSKHHGDPEDHPNRSLLPSECGILLEDRIVGGSTAGLGSFPWIARIGYTVKGNSRTLYRCGGALISSRYVITAAHCVTSLPSDFQLKGVRLGEVDARGDPDSDAVQCAEPVQDFGVAATAVHPQYDSPKFRHDVALVRLDDEARFSAYVSPICLPFGDVATKNYTGLKVTVAGWGATENGTASEELRYTRLAVVPTEQCAAAYRRTRIALGDTQVCAGGVAGVDSCDGDSGGPLTLAHQEGAGEPRQVLLGLVSFGARRCGSDGIPGVYSRVGAYLGWLLDNLQP